MPFGNHSPSYGNIFRTPQPAPYTKHGWHSRKWADPAHTYSPAYTERDFPTILKYSSHITFNSLTQFERFYPQVVADGNRVSCGLRINPEYSEVETDLYNPCAPGSRLGITADKLPELPQGVEGLHFHTLCESTSYDLEKTLAQVEDDSGICSPISNG